MKFFKKMSLRGKSWFNKWAGAFRGMMEEEKKEAPQHSEAYLLRPTDSHEPS